MRLYALCGVREALSPGRFGWGRAAPVRFLRGWWPAVTLAFLALTWVLSASWGCAPRHVSITYILAQLQVFENLIQNFSKICLPKCGMREARVHCCALPRAGERLQVPLFATGVFLFFRSGPSSEMRGAPQAEAYGSRTRGHR